MWEIMCCRVHGALNLERSCKSCWKRCLLCCGSKAGDVLGAWIFIESHSGKVSVDKETVTEGIAIFSAGFMLVPV